GGTLPGPAGALLAPGLGPAAGALGPGLGGVGAGAGGGQLGGDDLVHDRHVGLDPEDRLRQRRVGEDLGHQRIAPFTALRTKTSPPAGPGTAPLTSSSPRSASPSMTSRLSVVVRTLPY